MTKRLLLTALLLAATACAPAPEMTGEGTATDPTPAQATPALNPAQADYKAVNDQMHQAMGRIDPDADVAFMQQMAAHHMGAIAMADVALRHAKDPAVRQLAERIKAQQAPEIREMEAWLAKRDGATTPTVDAGATAVDHAAMGH